MKKEKCIVLVSNTPYRDEHDEILHEWINEGISLFCALGKECEEWEEAMDYACINLDTEGVVPGAFCVTTSHPHETLNEVVEFAKQWYELKKQEYEIKIKEI
jgi:hypothetical protein